MNNRHPCDALEIKHSTERLQEHSEYSEWTTAKRAVQHSTQEYSKWPSREYQRFQRKEKHKDLLLEGYLGWFPQEYWPYLTDSQTLPLRECRNDFSRKINT